MASETPTGGESRDRPRRVPSCRRYRFSRQQRIAHSAEFRAVFDSGRKSVGRYVILFVRDTESTGDTLPRLGVVASKRTFRRAADRARAKRLMREAFRLQPECFERGQDVVLLARHTILSVRRQDIEEELINLGKRVGLTKAAKTQ